MKDWLAKSARENKSFLIFISLMMVFRSAIADWNEVPTGSMQPTIVEGDRILINKLAYDLRIPFTHISLLNHADPSRGDIIVFDSAAAQKRLVKRVVGLPGDIVALRDNVLTINGQQITYASLAANGREKDLVENLLGVEHSVRINTLSSNLANFAPVVVPADHYLALGDNRDNSADSRVIGFVPRQEIIGRSRQVVLSFNYENYYIPRQERFFHKI